MGKLICNEMVLPTGLQEIHKMIGAN